jgi:nitrile hydratase
MEPEHNHADHDDHDHPHPTRPDDDGALTYYQAMEVAVRELLIDKGILTADEVRRQVEDMDNRTPARGAKVVARAWVDAEFKARLLTEGNSAVEEVGLDRGP